MNHWYHEKSVAAFMELGKVQRCGWGKVAHLFPYTIAVFVAVSLSLFVFLRRNVSSLLYSSLPSFWTLPLLCTSPVCVVE